MKLSIEKLSRFRNRVMASFIVDDLTAVNPEDAAAFIQFSQWVQQAGLKGEMSLIIGLRRSAEGRALPLHPDYVAERARAASYLDAYMEIMTHNLLYDFSADRIRADGPHEGIWMHDRARPMEEYLDYFRHIAARARDLGLRPAGLTLPGCGCPACVDFYNRQRLAEHAYNLNPAALEALLAVTAEGLLAGPVCGLFVGRNPLGPADVHVLAEEGGHAVYDVPPGVPSDLFGRWDRNPAHVNPDAYVSPDGQGGRLAQLLAQHTRTVVVYGHWQSLRPDTGIGNAAFREVAARLARFHGDEIVWMRPTEIAAYRHTERHTELRLAADGRSFTLAIPFAPLHPLTFRVLGAKRVKIRTPAGQLLRPDEPTVAGALFSFLPEPGRYEILTQRA